MNLSVSREQPRWLPVICHPCLNITLVVSIRHATDNLRLLENTLEGYSPELFNRAVEAFLHHCVADELMVNITKSPRCQRNKDKCNI